MRLRATDLPSFDIHIVMILLSFDQFIPNFVIFSTEIQLNQVHQEPNQWPGTFNQSFNCCIPAIDKSLPIISCG